MGEYHSAIAEPNADTDAEPDTFSFPDWKPDDPGSIADLDFRVSARKPVAFAIAMRFFFKERRPPDRRTKTNGGL